MRDGVCHGCQCPALRSHNYSCNGSTGHCYCLEKYTGQRCNIAACLKGSWSDWTPCSKACGNGTQTRTRQVYPPDQAVVEEEGLPGEECGDLDIEERSCNTWACLPSNGTECRVITALEPLAAGNCRTRRHYPVNKCRGTCAHADIDCCQPYLLTQKTYSLYCGDGKRVAQTFDDIQQCGCLSC